jgi:Ca2+-binding EF-hand superfamily protein
MGGCVTIPRGSTYDLVQVIYPNHEPGVLRKEKRKPTKIQAVGLKVENVDSEGRDSVHQHLQELFERVLSVFDLKSHQNAFMDVRALIMHFNDDMEVEKLSLKLTKHIFDHYDVNRNGYLELSEIEPFCVDLLFLFGFSQMDAKKLALMRREMTNCIVQGEPGLTFVNFWSSNIIKGSVLGRYAASVGRSDSSNSRENFAIRRRELSSSGREFAKQLLKSSKLKLDFHPLFQFFGVKESGNLLADISLLHEVFVKEAQEEIYHIEMNKTQTRRITRMEKMLMQRLLKYVFQFYDRDGSGKIERNELYFFMKDIITVMPPQYCTDDTTSGVDNIEHLTQQIMDEFIEEVDDDEDGMISYEELAHHLPIIFRRMVNL